MQLRKKLRKKLTVIINGPVQNSSTPNETAETARRSTRYSEAVTKNHIGAVKKVACGAPK